VVRRKHFQSKVERLSWQGGNFFTVRRKENQGKKRKEERKSGLKISLFFEEEGKTMSICSSFCL
jgi:hypothetical protein